MSTITLPSRADTYRDRFAGHSPSFESPAPEPEFDSTTIEATAGLPVLVVDDEQSIRDTCAILLRHEGYDVTTCSRGQEAIELLSRKAFPIIVLDLHLPHIDGLAVLKAARAANEKVIVIMMTGRPSVESSVVALEHGAWEYLPKPFSATQLQILVGRAAHAVRTRGGAQGQLRTEDGSRPPSMLGQSPAFRAMTDLATKVAATDASIVITGESGSGKEQLARFIHEHSPRANRPFVVVNCAALPEQLVDAEMFSHGGTLFLDELLEMSKPVQAKLLRVIQDGVVRRAGSEGTDMVVNVRFITATTRSPDEAVEQGLFRDDLLYRLRVVPIHVPALRERREDIPLLANHFLDKFWARHRASSGLTPAFTDAAMDALQAHAWNGNIREMQNVIEHAVVLAEQSPAIGVDALLLTADPQDAPAMKATFPVATALADEPYHTARERTISDFELQYVTALLDKAGGNMSRAARMAGMDRATLYRLVERHDLMRGHGGNGWLVERIARTPANGQAALDTTNFGAF